MNFSEKYKQQKKDLPVWIKQAGKFIIVGLINTALDFSVYFLLTRLIGFMGTHPVLAKGISFSAGVLNSYIWNRKWTFKSTAQPIRTIFPFIFVSVTGLLINTGVMQLLFMKWKWSEVVAIILATAVTITWNFGLNKILVFRK